MDAAIMQFIGLKYSGASETAHIAPGYRVEKKTFFFLLWYAQKKCLCQVYGMTKGGSPFIFTA